MRELSLNVMDVTQNSISAGAKMIKIIVREDKTADTLSISIEDNGRGMSEEQVRSVTDPFYTTRTTRNVGLGVPLFKMEAEMTGGSFEISSKPGVGTKLTAVFKPSSVDMIPLGDINGTILLLVTCNTDIDFQYTRSLKEAEEREFSLNTQELKEILGDEVALNSPDVVIWIKEFLEENTRELINQ